MTSSFVMLVMSVLCITLSTFLIVEGFYCHCLGISLLESNSTSSRCVKYDPNDEIIKEPGLTTEALFGALFMFAGVCLAALWRDSINSAAVAARLDQFYQALRRFSYSIFFLVM